MHEGSNRSHELRVLLLAVFDADELRRFVRFGPDGVTLAPELPGDIASQAKLVDAAVDLFERVRAVTDPAFWRRLAAARERWTADIERVRALYMAGGASAMPRLQVTEDLLDALQVSGFFREVARLFDVPRVVNLLRRVGIDASNFPTVCTPTPKAWWEFVAGELRRGAVGEPQVVVRDLVHAAREDYPANPVLARAAELTR